MLLAGAAREAGALKLSTGQDQYLRYELVDIVASTGQSETAGVYPPILWAQVQKKGRLVVAPGDLRQVPLHAAAPGRWEGFWPIPFNPEWGDYRVRIRQDLADGTTLAASAAFRVHGREPYVLPPGFSVVTDEGGRRGPYATPGLDEQEPKSWRNLVRWADAMGADALWQCLGQTHVWGSVREDRFPWPSDTLNLMQRVGEAAHAAGMKYGAYIIAFVVIGDRPEASGYTFTLGYDKNQDTLRSLRYVSLGCERRLADIIGLLQKFEASPAVDFLGLDYMRTDFGGYEFAEEFVRDMSIATPPEWPGWSPSERRLWVARLLEVERDAAARERWEWWRAHKVGLVLARIVAAVRPQKPLWVFSLGWKTGHQHGQDIAMMLDAGVAFNAPMFYSIAKPDFPHMLTDWRVYLRHADCSIVVGEPVDWNLLGQDLELPAPQEHFDRQLETLQALRPLAKSFGLFWHDLSRAHYGFRGPYGTWEWVLAGAASFSENKRAAGRISCDLQILAPPELVVNQETEIQVGVVNATSGTLNAVSVEAVPLPRLSLEDRQAWRLYHLPPGPAPQTVRFRFRTGQIYEPNGGRQMIAFRAHSQQDAPRDDLFRFVYLPVVAQPSLGLPGGTTGAATGQPRSVTPAGASRAPSAKPGGGK